MSPENRINSERRFDGKTKKGQRQAGILRIRTRQSSLLQAAKRQLWRQVSEELRFCKEKVAESRRRDEKMSENLFDFRLKVNSKGETIGFELSGKGDADALFFIIKFPKAFSEGRAKVHVRKNEIIFESAQYPFSLKFALDPEKACKIRKILHPKPRLSFKTQTAWGGRLEVSIEK